MNIAAPGVIGGGRSCTPSRHRSTISSPYMLARPGLEWPSSAPYLNLFAYAKRNV
jgi:hypothetical protein